MESSIYLFNPKRCGLFGQLGRRGGGVKMTHWEIVVSGCFNFYPSSTNSISYESWNIQLKFETSVRSQKLIVWPQEVSEVTEVKMKKILGEILKSSVFDLENVISLKRILIKIVIQIWNKLRGFCYEKILRRKFEKSSVFLHRKMLYTSKESS